MPQIISRYGYSEQVEEPNNEWITHKLIAELCSERFDEPDDEHTQVSVSNEHCSITTDVSGLVTFDNMDLLEGESSDLPETLHLRDIPDSDLIALWQCVVTGDRDGLLSHPWCSYHELPAFSKHYYRNRG